MQICMHFFLQSFSPADQVGWVARASWPLLAIFASRCAQPVVELMTF
jgi:hypothetical protein